MPWTPYWTLLRSTTEEWIEDKAPRLGAALAFYSVLSLGPLLFILISVAALVFDRETVSIRLLGQIRGLVGDEGAEAIASVIGSSQPNTENLYALAVGLATLFLGATGVFGQLQDALNTIWEVRPKPGRGIMWILRERFLSFAVVLGTGFLLLVSLAVSAGITAVTEYAADYLPGMVLQGVDFIITFGTITLLFAMIFKILPDVKIAWGDVWIGAALTAALFSVGKLLIGMYLGHNTLSAAYGASGSLVVLLLWVYYSSQILFFGAEFTQVYAKMHGSRLVPERGAQPLTEEARAQQGLDRA